MNTIYFDDNFKKTYMIPITYELYVRHFGDNSLVPFYCSLLYPRYDVDNAREVSASKYYNGFAIYSSIPLTFSKDVRLQLFQQMNPTMFDF